MNASTPRGTVAARAVGMLLAATVASGCIIVHGEVNPFSRRPEPLEERTIEGRGDKKILLVDFSGVITSEERHGPFGIGREESTVSRVEAELDQAARDEDVAAVVLRINSPGGTVTASDIIYDRVMRFKADTGRPVLVQMLDVAASGGYYVALAGDELIASPTTVTGSIGVLFTSISLEGLFDKIGILNQSVRSGSMKDIGSPLRNMTPAERQVMEALIGDMQQRFVGLVLERRPNLTGEMKAEMVDGRVFSAQQALVGGLVDDVGYLDGTIARAKQRAGVAEARVVTYRRPEEYSDSIYARAEPGPAQVNLFNVTLDPLPSTPSFLYLWAP